MAFSLPTDLPAMEATSVDTIPIDEGWQYERSAEPANGRAYKCKASGDWY